MKEYEAVASADLLETIRMEFSEIKAEAYSSLGKVSETFIKLVSLN